MSLPTPRTLSRDIWPTFSNSSSIFQFLLYFFSSKFSELETLTFTDQTRWPPMWRRWLPLSRWPRSYWLYSRTHQTANDWINWIKQWEKSFQLSRSILWNENLYPPVEHESKIKDTVEECHCQVGKTEVDLWRKPEKDKNKIDKFHNRKLKVTRLIISHQKLFLHPCLPNFLSMMKI